MLLYGESGTGKTTFAATFPDPVRWYICSGGDKPGELKSINTPENRKRIKPVIVRGFDHFLELLDKDTGQYESSILDHATGFADAVLGEIIGKPVPAQKAWGLASMQQYGQLSLQCKEAFRKLLNQPGNIVIIAQQRTFGGKDEGGNPDVIQPTIGAALTPSVTGWLNPACDYVVQTFKRPNMVHSSTTVAGRSIATSVRGKGVTWCARCEPHDVFITKFRLPAGYKLPDVIENPTYEKLLRVIRGEK